MTDATHRADGEPEPPAAPRSPRWLPRVIVYGLLGALVVVAARDTTVWPLSAWRLFSELRTPRATSVSVVVEGPAGERLLDTTDLWPEYRSVGHAIAIARRDGEPGLANLCEVLLDEVGRVAPDVVGLRVERTVTDSSAGTPAQVLERSVLVRCEP